MVLLWNYHNWCVYVYDGKFSFSSIKFSSIFIFIYYFFPPHLVVFVSWEMCDGVRCFADTRSDPRYQGRTFSSSGVFTLSNVCQNLLTNFSFWYVGNWEMWKVFVLSLLGLKFVIHQFIFHENMFGLLKSWPRKSQFFDDH